MEERDRQEIRKKEKEISELRDRLQTVELAENKKLRSQLHEASTSKTSEQLQLRDSLAKVGLERDKYKEQYSALFRQLQQSMDSVQLLQTEKDRLQEQIREIQRLSGGARSSSAVPEVHQVQPESLAGGASPGRRGNCLQLNFLLSHCPGSGTSPSPATSPTPRAATGEAAATTPKDAKTTTTTTTTTSTRLQGGSANSATTGKKAIR